MSVATTILEQLGNSTAQISRMIGAYQFLSFENGVRFRFKARAKNGSNGVQITLTPEDLYKVEFTSRRGLSYKVKATFEGIYADDLTSLFERETGLYLSLFG